MDYRMLFELTETVGTLVLYEPHLLRLIAKWSRKELHWNTFLHNASASIGKRVRVF